MKKVLLSLVVIFLAHFMVAQNQETVVQNRTISVTGSAEVVVPPDQIELTIVLKEYRHRSKRVELDKIEAEFISILKKHNIDEEQLFFGNSGYYWYYWWSYRNKDYKQKTFKVNLDTTTDFLALVKDLDIKGIGSLRISNTTSHELQKLRKEVKISALRAAKVKAQYLLESIDEKIGRVVSIEEVAEKQNYYWRNNQNLISNAVITRNSSNNEIENVATIKLRYEVKAQFEIE